MHFEILVEDASGKNILQSIMQKNLGPTGQNHTYRIISYKGLGHIPKGLGGKTDPKKRVLLDRLPRLLKGYGKSLRNIPGSVIVVVDLDHRDCLVFKQELMDILNGIDPCPTTLFRITIEEMEAWLLGDRKAVTEAYKGARESVLDSYEQDSICGTWENLADAIHKGGSRKLKELGYPITGEVKCEWAREISPLLDIENNRSKSFRVFREGVRNLAEK